MPTTIEISTEEGTIHGNGTIDYLIQNPGLEIQIPVVFRDFISGIMKMATFYKEKLRNDGRLFGNERFDLVRILDEIIGEGVFLRQLLDPKERKFFSLIHKGYGYNIFFEVIGNSWQCNGNLGNVKSINIGKFSLWMEKRLSTQLSDLIHKLKDAYKDGIMTSHEKMTMVTSLEKIILGVILVRKSIISGEMD